MKHCAYAIGTSHTNQKINVFRVRNKKKVMHYNGIQSQRDALEPNGAF